MLVRSLLVLSLLSLAVAEPALARDDGWPVAYTSVAHNPADALAELPIEESTYDPATHCSKRPKPGMTALVDWLERNADGVSWGTYRCEKWGRGSASLHAEGRAVDWALDVDVPAQRREAERLIALLLAPDRLGQTQALARRMGVEEIIWDCGYWAAGMDERARTTVPVQARQAAAQGRQDGRAPQPPAHRPHQGRRGQADVVLDAPLTRRSVAATTPPRRRARPA